jgi:hypothetical protein
VGREAGVEGDERGGPWLGRAHVRVAERDERSQQRRAGEVREAEGVAHELAARSDLAREEVEGRLAARERSTSAGSSTPFAPAITGRVSGKAMR